MTHLNDEIFEKGWCHQAGWREDKRKIRQSTGTDVVKIKHSV